MAQIFHRTINNLARISLLAAAAGALAAGGSFVYLSRSPLVTGAGVTREQPIQFSHAHHVGGMGVDCRYCHTSVETSAIAGIPPTKTCMNCHAQIWTNSLELEPVRESFAKDQPIAWIRVHDLPDFVYFDHSAHVSKGVGCSTCHGRVDRMPLVHQHASLQMEWCLDCHRHPERFLRPRGEVLNSAWETPADQLERGRKLAAEYGVRPRTSCSTCHR
jgi:hypothetical protein